MAKQKTDRENDLLVEITSKDGSLGIWRISADNMAIKLDEIGRDTALWFEALGLRTPKQKRASFSPIEPVNFPRKKNKKGKKAKKA